MAIEKILNTRILLKTATLEEWNASTLPLKKGEIAIATVAATAGTGLTEPVCMIKIGEDGVKTFKDLDWNLYAKASDVVAAAKSEDTLRAFVNGVIADAGIASDEAMQELSGKVTTAEGNITALQTAVGDENSGLVKAVAALNGLVGDTKVAEQISKAISDLNLATTYAAIEHKHEIADVNGLEDRLVAAKNAGDDAAEALGTYKTLNDAAVKVNTDAIAGIKNGETMNNFKAVEEALAGKQAAGDYATKTEAQGYANAKDAAIQAAQTAADNAATAAANALTDANAYTDAEIKEWVGDTTVAAQIATTIANYTTTADMNTAIATAKEEAVSHANDLDSAMNTRVLAVEGKAHTHSFVESELNKIVDGDVAKWNAAEQNAKDYADDLDEVMDARVLALEGKFIGDSSVDNKIANAVSAEATLREAADAGLQEQVTANANAISGLNGLVGDKNVSEAIAEAVKEEADRAKGIEGGLETRLAAVEADYLTSVEEKALQDQITANASAIELLTNGVKADEVDGVNDLIKYVNEHGAEVTGMKADIKANADAIGKATEGETAGTGLYKRIEDAEAAITTKAAQDDLEALDERVEAIETEHNAETTGLKARLSAAETDIGALKTKVGDKAVSEQITDITNPLAERVVELEKVDHDHANKDELDLIASGDKAKWDAKLEDVTAAADSGLKATKTGNSVAIEIDNSVIFIFDCGGAN